jgi:hypothetical protein
MALREVLKATIAEFPATLSRSPLPVRPSGWIGNTNMGPAPRRCKRINAAQVRSATGPISGSAIPARLIVYAGFDKGGPPPV